MLLIFGEGGKMELKLNEEWKLVMTPTEARLENTRTGIHYAAGSTLPSGESAGALVGRLSREKPLSGDQESLAKSFCQSGANIVCVEAHLI
jgi:hypothetical protein